MLNTLKMKKGILYVILFAVAASFSSCVKDKYDAPPDSMNVDPTGVTATTTIAQLKTHYIPGRFVLLTDSVVIAGIVTADDKSGNFYKAITFQDSTGGIQLNIDETNFYKDYPIGRRIFVKCKGLYIGDYGGNIQLGGYINNTGAQPTLGRIPQSNVPNYVLKGKWGLFDQIKPKKVNILQLDKYTYQNMLIQLDSVEYNCSSSVGVLYADAINKLAVSRTIEDSRLNTATVYSSGYADFANTYTPRASGTIIGIFTIYVKSSGVINQISIRDLYDVQMTNPNRFDGSVVGTPSEDKIDSLRQMYARGITSLGCGSVIRGVVVSDALHGNFTNKSLYIEDASGGINVYFSSAHSFNQGDSVTIGLSGATISVYKGTLELSGVLVVNSVYLATGVQRTTTTTIANAVANEANLESSLVTFNNVTITGGTNYQGNLTLTDASGSIAMYTGAAATFAGTAVPTHPVNITGIISSYNGTPQIAIRNLSDVQ